MCLFSCCFVFLCVYVCVCRGGFYYANKVRNSSDLPNTFLLLIPSSSSPSFFYSLSLSLLLSLSLSLTDMYAHTHFLTKQEQSLLKANAHLVPYHSALPLYLSLIYTRSSAHKLYCQAVSVVQKSQNSALFSSCSLFLQFYTDYSWVIDSLLFTECFAGRKQVGNCKEICFPLTFDSMVVAL